MPNNTDFTFHSRVYFCIIMSTHKKTNKLNIISAMCISLQNDTVEIKDVTAETKQKMFRTHTSSICFVLVSTITAYFDNKDRLRAAINK